MISKSRLVWSWTVVNGNFRRIIIRTELTTVGSAKKSEKGGDIYISIRKMGIFMGIRFRRFFAVGFELKGLQKKFQRQKSYVVGERRKVK